MPDHAKQADLESLLDALGEAAVEFIVVGGAAAEHRENVTPTRHNYASWSGEWAVLELPGRSRERGSL